MSIFSINTSGLANLPKNTEGIRAAARAVQSAAKSFEDEVTTAKSTWNGMRPLYEGPGEQTLATSLAPAVLDASELKESTESIKKAAITLAEAIDDLNSRKGTFWDSTVPAQETNYQDNYTGAAASRQYPHAKATLQRELQGDFNAIVDDWVAAQEAFNTTVGGVERVSTNTRAHFDYGTNSTRVNTAARLYRIAMGEGATAEDVEAYYAYLGKLSPQEIEALASTHPEARTTPPPVSGAPPAGDGYPSGRHGAAWWDGLSPEQQTALTAMLPALVGNTNGVPYSDRHRANVTTLNLVRNDPAYTDKQLEAFESIADALAESSGGSLDGNSGKRFLNHFIPVDPISERPLASISIGNLDTADDVTVSVSGMGSGTHNMDGEVGKAQTLYDKMQGNHAVVAWIGYDSPDQPLELAKDKNLLPRPWEVVGNEHAERGGTQLAIFLDGLHETRDARGDVPTTNVTAHSYGTTTAAVGLTQTRHDVDRYVMYGSAGIDPAVADHASDFNVKADKHGNPAVYATIAYDDPWAPRGQIPSGRISPTAEEFGAYTFSSDGEGNVPGEAGTGHGQTEGSSSDTQYGYLERGSQSLNSMSEILNGNPDEIDYLKESRYDSDPKLEHQVMEKGRDAYDDVVDGAEAAWNWAGDRKDDIVDFAGDAKDEVAERANDVKDAVGDAWGWAKDKLP
ncbi:hypothetical protein BJH93_01255 [Kocuria polaris]|nr:hypothetical protein [Kocuria polaris]